MPLFSTGGDGGKRPSPPAALYPYPLPTIYRLLAQGLASFLVDDEMIQVKCEFCIGDNEERFEFEVGHQLRDHLIKSHAEEVARAFLFPNIADPKHIFLMGCVAFNTATVGVDGETCSSAELSPTDTVSPIEGLPVEEGSLDENDDETGVGVNLVDVIATLIGSTMQPTINGKTRKRGFPSPTKDTPMKRFHRINDDVMVNDGFSAHSTFDPASLFENAEALASASGMVENGRKIKEGTCKSCHQGVSMSGRYRHVLEVHVNKEDMFTCSACDFSHCSSIAEARNHAGTAHPDENACPQSNELKYRTLIQQWMRRCFDDWKTVDIRPEDDLLESDPRTPLGNIDPANVDERTCQLCWEESRYPGRHLAQKHLRKPLYECPVCEGFGSYESCTVVKHMMKVHTEVEDPQPISNLEKYAEEIRDLQIRCFPKRPMKLVKASMGSKPRERHLCNKCNTQVAQSDRQRHVYHKHLQKTRVFECPICDFASNYDVHRVKWHLKWEHKEEGKDLEPVSHENEYREAIDRLNEECFPGWTHRRKPFWWLDQEEAQQRVSQIRAKKKKEDTSMEQDSIEEESVENGVDELLSQSLSEYACKLCGKDFKPSANFLRHVAKEHLSIPLYQCPLCEGFGAQDAYGIRAHTLKAHSRADVQPLSNMETHSEEIQRVYSQCFPGRKLKNLPDKPLKREKSSAAQRVETRSKRRSNIAESSKSKQDKSEPRISRGRHRWDDDDGKVVCTQCNMEMKTEDRQIHVYRHHLKESRLYECPLCDFSHHACSSDVRSHIKFVHRNQSEVMPRANLLEFSEKIAEWNDKCFPGWINRRLPTIAAEDFSSCRLCGEEVRQTSRHIAEVHLKISLHQCPLCEYGAAESRLVIRHLRNNHTKKEAKGQEPISNVALRRADFSAVHDKCFPGRPKRLSNITISEEGRRAKCRSCGSTVSKKKRLSHLLERHLNIAFIKCKSCDFTHTYDEKLLKEHITQKHENSGKNQEEISLNKHFGEVSECSRACFPDWDLKKADLQHYSYVL
ncbi:unnamed protein product, partial [Mesorhabditis belari]|uniref:C2H2-type domain-containing protein n=1 Tax=Mesorhabditis belari TaxID=2138241 RepID=A0AAF3E943_9BILA